jgi:hypothetical protein
MAKEMFRIRGAQFYVGGKKIGTAETGSFKINGNDEQHITAENVSYSDGTVTTEMTVNVVVPVDGQTSALVDAILNKKNLNIQFGVVDGKVMAVQMRCLTADYSTDNKTGSLKGVFSFGGGAPDPS